MAMGTPEYMAPEQAAGKPADARSDVYAVGAILYEMLSGRAPYEGENFMEILTKKATVEPLPLSKLRSDVPEVVEKVVMRAMARDPADRPRSMEALEYELTKCLAGRGAAVAKMLGVPLEAAMAAGNALPPDGGAGDAAVAGLLAARNSAAVRAPAVGLANAAAQAAATAAAAAGGSALAAATAPAVSAAPRPIVREPSRPSTPVPLELTAEEKRAYRIGPRWARTSFVVALLLIGGGAGAYWWFEVREPSAGAATAGAPDDGSGDKPPVVAPGPDGPGLVKPPGKVPVPGKVIGKPGDPSAKGPEDRPVPKPPEDRPPPRTPDDRPDTPKDPTPGTKPPEPSPDPVLVSAKPPRDKKETKTLLAKAKSLEALRKYAEARGLYERVAAGKFQRPDGLLGVARVAWQTKDAEGAASFARQALDAGAGDAARLLLGHAYFKQQKYDEAIAMYKEVLKNDPRSSEALRSLRAAEKAKGGTP